MLLLPVYDKFGKRAISCVLAIVLFMTNIPFQTRAEEISDTQSNVEDSSQHEIIEDENNESKNCPWARV